MPLSDTLRKLIALGGATGSTELREWASLELRGYVGNPAEEHQGIWPSILYFGTPVALVTTMNADQTPNIGPMSSAWALGYTRVAGQRFGVLRT